MIKNIYLEFKLELPEIGYLEQYRNAAGNVCSTYPWLRFILTNTRDYDYDIAMESIKTIIDRFQGLSDGLTKETGEKLAIEFKQYCSELKNEN